MAPPSAARRRSSEKKEERNDKEEFEKACQIFENIETKMNGTPKSGEKSSINKTVLSIFSTVVQYYKTVDEGDEKKSADILHGLEDDTWVEILRDKELRKDDKKLLKAFTQLFPHVHRAAMALRRSRGASPGSKCANCSTAAAAAAPKPVRRYKKGDLSIDMVTDYHIAEAMDLDDDQPHAPLTRWARRSGSYGAPPRLSPMTRGESEKPEPAPQQVVKRRSSKKRAREEVEEESKENESKRVRELRGDAADAAAAVETPPSPITPKVKRAKLNSSPTTTPATVRRACINYPTWHARGTEGRWPCGGVTCKRVFASHSDANIHMISEHEPTEGAVRGKCIDCAETGAFNELIVHRKTNPECGSEGSYLAYWCERDEREESRQTHIEELSILMKQCHHVGCKQARRPFDSFEQAIEHNAREHNSLVLYVCSNPHCSREYTKPHHLLTHVDRYCPAAIMKFKRKPLKKKLKNADQE